MATVKVTTDVDGTYEIGTEVGTIVKGVDYFGEALELTGLLMRAEFLGDPKAAAELEARGCEPPSMQPDAEPIPGRH